MNENQKLTPYFDTLNDYAKSEVLTFTCPGHQRGRGADPKLVALMGAQALRADSAQILGMDDIHQPTGSLKEAQALAAEAYGADRSYFLINGSSSGNHIMILTACNPGEKLILPRNAHKSATGGLIMSGVMPVYIQPEFDGEMQVDHTVTPENVARALKEHPDAKAVFILSPTYYGAAADLKTIIDLVHQAGKIALVDEAWGPHHHFHPELPVSAVEAGADICVNSTHKILSGLSQGSMIHIKGNRVDPGRLAALLRIYLSTSPFCPIMASLDVARMQMATQGLELLDRTLKNAEWARERINQIPGLRAYGKEIIGRPGVHNLDLTRLVITGRPAGFTGYQMEKLLRYDYGIQVEMSDMFNIVVINTIAHQRADLEQLAIALEEMTKRYHGKGDFENLMKNRDSRKPLELPDWAPQHLTPRRAFFGQFKVVPLEESAGEICVEVVTPYPPGIPILCPGEEITQDILDYLMLDLKAGVRIQGPADPTLNTIRVVA